MDGIELTFAHWSTGVGMAKPRVDLWRMQESEEPMERSFSEMPWMQEGSGVPLCATMSGTKVGAAAVKHAHYPCIDAGEVLPSSEAKGEDRAVVFSEIVTPWDPRESIWSKVLNIGRITVPGESLINPAHPKPLLSAEDTYREYFLESDIGRKVSDKDRFACVYGFNKYPAGLVGYERTFTVPGGPGAQKDMHGNFKRSILSVAAFWLASTLQVQAVGAIAPETARDGFMQAGNSMADTSNFWFGVVACIGVLFAIIGVVVALMQLRRSRRNQTATAPTQQMLTMQRRSRVQYIVEEETIHRIDEMV